MRFSNLLIGRPLATSEERAEHIGCSAGIPIFGLDALSSAAYGPEAALTLLIPLGLEGVDIIMPISAAIIALLIIVYFSYRQTIEAYPRGGGSYTVASENLGHRAGLLAAAALMIDYVLTAAVGISAGVGALISAFPSLQAHTLGLCLGILVVLTLVNIRGVRDAGSVFVVPTYLFVGSLLVVIVVGIVKVVMGHGHAAPVVAPPHLPAATAAISLWLILKVFASGCTAMTGVEAVSNGVLAFRAPTTKNAQKTLTIIIALLIVLLAGIAFLCHAYGVGATDPEGSGYQSVLSQLIGAVMGRGIFYYVSIGSILLVLSLSANTAFADFPRLTRAIALDDYLPHVFLIRGRRLLYSHGVYALVGLTGALLVLFRGVTDRLIPLYAIGAFLAFTLSQAGMVVHWWKNRTPHWVPRMVVNGFGAFATGITLLVVLVAKFVDGAWVTALLIPIMIAIMAAVKRHYIGVDKETQKIGPIDLAHIAEPIVVIPVDRWSRITEKGLRFALMLSKEVRAVHVDCEEDEESVCEMWEANIAAPLRAANMIIPELVLLHSPYRFVIQPVVDYVLDLERQNEDRQIAVLVPELVVRRWYQNLLHNQRANLLKLLLLLRGNQRILVINIPWYMERHTDVKVLEKNEKEKREEATAGT
jgi:amino acid transporter